MIYALIFILLIFAQSISALTEFKYNNLEKGYFILISLTLIFIAAFRDGIGYDFFSYEKIYNYIHVYQMGMKDLNIETGYYFLMKYSNSYITLVVISSSVAIFLKLIFIYKYSENKFMSLLLYFSGVFIMFDMGVIRQGIAIAIALISIKYIKEKSFMKFMLIIILSSFFHISSLVFIPLYFIANKSLNRWHYYIVASIVLILSFLDMSSLIVNISNVIPIDLVKTKVTYYSSIYTGDSTISLIKKVIFLVIFVESYKRFNISDSLSYIFLNGYFLSIIYMGIFSGIDIIGGRGPYGLYFMQIFIFPILFRNSKNTYYKLGIYIIVIALSYYSLMGLIDSGTKLNQPYIPYKNVLF